MAAYTVRQGDQARALALAFHSPEKINEAYRPPPARHRRSLRRWWGKDTDA